jgi:hypothetical protein
MMPHRLFSQPFDNFITAMLLIIGWGLTLANIQAVLVIILTAITIGYKLWKWYKEIKEEKKN